MRLMNVEAALELANTLIFDETGQRLSTLHAYIFRAAWLDQTYEEIAQTCRYSETHLKKVGSALWELLSIGLKEEVNKKTFRAALERRQQSKANATSTNIESAPVQRISQPATLGLKQFGYSLPMSAAELQFPEGPLELGSPFYIERPPVEFCCYYTISKPGSLIRIKAPYQMGKTSLLAKVRQYARQQGYHTVALNLQLVDSKMFYSLDQFLQWFCARVTRSLQLPLQLSEYWNDVFGSKTSCKDYFENYLLPQLEQPLVLILDEVDAVFPYSEIADNFFALLRAWYEEAKTSEIWQNLRLVLAYSTDAYVSLNINQSPFNVGLPIKLPEFNVGQVEKLAHCYKLDWTTTEVKQLTDLVGGHPSLLRIALYYIASNQMSLGELLRLASTEAGPYSNHLQRYLSMLQQQPELATALKILLSTTEPVYLNPPEIFQLNRMGLIDLQDSQPKFRCELYRQYFSDRLLSQL